MDKLFLTIVNMSLTGAFVIAAICLVRLPLKKAPKIISYCLWAVAGFRLVFPFSIESVFSLLPFKAQTIPSDLAMQSVPRIDSGVAIVDNIISASLPTPALGASVNPLQIWITIGAFVWFTGVAIMLIYGVVSYVRLKRKLQNSVCTEANIYEVENIKSPFVLGILGPKIYLPIGLSMPERGYIVLHERTHIRRRDHIVKFAAYFVLCLHWFNPLAWAAFLLMGVDMEMSCDERVLKEIGGETKKDYSLTLLSFATERRIIGGSPLAFGEGSLKERIKNILNFKKPSRIIIIAAVALVAALSVGLALNRANGNANYDIPDITATEMIDGAQAKALRFGYSWFDGKNGVVADAIAPWQGEYTDENTLVIDGEMGQNSIALSAEKPMTASYVIYLPDGTVYDSGTREPHDSLSPRLRWTKDNAISIIAPFEPGEYIYEVTIGWKENDLKVTYGLKLVMTGQRNAYDEALRVIWNHHNDALSVAYKGLETLPDAEYAGDCYVFEAELPDGMVRAAVSKERGIFFTYRDGTWFAYTGVAEWNGAMRYMTLDDVRAIGQKIGPDLTMEDLSGFIGEDVGSGLYVMQYNIEDASYFLIVGSGDGKTVMYANLVHAVNGGTNEFIDIRYYDIDKFIADETKELVAAASDSGVNMIIENVDLSGISFIIENTSEREYTYGETYRLYVQKNNSWVPVEPIIENWGFNSIGYIVLPQSKTDAILIDWKWLYGELADGEYKFEKEILFIRDPGDLDRYVIDCEFTLP